MKRRRGMGRRKPTPAPVVGVNEPHLSMVYQEADSTTLDDFNNVEFDSRMDAKALQADSRMIGQQLGIEKQIVNEGDVNNASSNSLRKANIPFFWGNPSKRNGIISTNTSTGFGSSSRSPNHNAALAQGERTCTCQEEQGLPQQDPRYNKEELDTSLLVIKIIMKSDAARPFNVPVDPIALGIPDYFDVIYTPMDFGTICKNLENGVKYANSEDVFKDVRLIWENCSKYNKKGNHILELMKRVKTNFIKFWAAADLYMEPPQPNRRKECPLGLDTDQSACQLQDQAHWASSTYTQRQQSPTIPNTRHNKHAQRCPVGLDSDNSTHHQLQDQIISSQVVHLKGCPVGMDTNNPSCQLQDQTTRSQGQSQRPSSNFSQRHQPPQSCNTPQTDTSSNQPQASPRQPGTSSSHAHASLQQPKLNNDIASTSKKTYSRSRGPTRCLDLWNSYGKRIYVATNELGQPVGPEASRLTNFLGTVARDGLMSPLIYADWKSMPDTKKEKMWKQVELRFHIDPICKDWVLKSLCTKWRNWKSMLKSAHYNKHATDEKRLADRDERVLPDQWATLVSYWGSAEAEAVSAQNKANRAQQKFSHTAGTKSFACVREEERVKRPDGKDPSHSELFVLTRTRKDGQPVNEASAAVISQLQERTIQQEVSLDNGKRNQDDVFSEIVGYDRRGRVRTCGGLGLSSPSNLGANLSRAMAMKMVSVANSEVREIKERMVAMEQNYSQMVTQMSSMMVMMSSMQKSPDKHQPNFATDTSGASVGLPQQAVDSPGPDVSNSKGVPKQQVRTSTSRCPVSPRETRASKRRKMQK